MRSPGGSGNNAMTKNPFRWRWYHQVGLLFLALVGMAINSVFGYLAEAAGAVSFDYWMWGEWPFDPREPHTGSFWWMVGGGITGVAIGYAFRLMRSDGPK